MKKTFTTGDPKESKSREKRKDLLAAAGLATTSVGAYIWARQRTPLPSTDILDRMRRMSGTAMGTLERITDTVFGSNKSLATRLTRIQAAKDIAAMSIEANALKARQLDKLSVTLDAVARTNDAVLVNRLREVRGLMRDIKHIQWTPNILDQLSAIGKEAEERSRLTLHKTSVNFDLDLLSNRSRKTMSELGQDLGGVDIANIDLVQLTSDLRRFRGEAATSALNLGAEVTIDGHRFTSANALDSHIFREAAEIRHAREMKGFIGLHERWQVENAIGRRSKGLLSNSALTPSEQALISKIERQLKDKLNAKTNTRVLGNEIIFEVTEKGKATKYLNIPIQTVSGAGVRRETQRKLPSIMISEIPLQHPNGISSYNQRILGTLSDELMATSPGDTDHIFGRIQQSINKFYHESDNLMDPMHGNIMLQFKQEKVPLGVYEDYQRTLNRIGGTVEEMYDYLLNYSHQRGGVMSHIYRQTDVNKQQNEAIRQYMKDKGIGYRNKPWAVLQTLSGTSPNMLAIGKVLLDNPLRFVPLGFLHTASGQPHQFGALNHIINRSTLVDPRELVKKGFFTGKKPDGSLVNMLFSRDPLLRVKNTPDEWLNRNVVVMAELPFTNKNAPERLRESTALLNPTMSKVTKLNKLRLESSEIGYEILGHMERLSPAKSLNPKVALFLEVMHQHRDSYQTGDNSIAMLDNFGNVSIQKEMKFRMGGTDRHKALAELIHQEHLIIEARDANNPLKRLYKEISHGRKHLDRDTINIKIYAEELREIMSLHQGESATHGYTHTMRNRGNMNARTMVGYKIDDYGRLKIGVKHGNMLLEKIQSTGFKGTVDKATWGMGNVAEIMLNSLQDISKKEGREYAVLQAMIETSAQLLSSSHISDTEKRKKMHRILEAAGLDKGSSINIKSGMLVTSIDYRPDRLVKSMAEAADQTAKGLGITSPHVQVLKTMVTEKVTGVHAAGTTVKEVLEFHGGRDVTSFLNELRDLHGNPEVDKILKKDAAEFFFQLIDEETGAGRFDFLKAFGVDITKHREQLALKPSGVMRKMFREAGLREQVSGKYTMPYLFSLGWDPSKGIGQTFSPAMHVAVSLGSRAADTMLKSSRASGKYSEMAQKSYAWMMDNPMEMAIGYLQQSALATKSEDPVMLTRTVKNMGWMAHMDNVDPSNLAHSAKGTDFDFAKVNTNTIQFSDFVKEYEQGSAKLRDKWRKWYTLKQGEDGLSVRAALREAQAELDISKKYGISTLDGVGQVVYAESPAEAVTKFNRKFGKDVTTNDIMHLANETLNPDNKNNLLGWLHNHTNNEGNVSIQFSEDMLKSMRRQLQMDEGEFVNIIHDELWRTMERRVNFNESSKKKATNIVQEAHTLIQTMFGGEGRGLRMSMDMLTNTHDAVDGVVRGQYNELGREFESVLRLMGEYGVDFENDRALPEEVVTKFRKAIAKLGVVASGESYAQDGMIARELSKVRKLNYRAYGLADDNIELLEQRWMKTTGSPKRLQGASLPMYSIFVNPKGPQTVIAMNETQKSALTKYINKLEIDTEVKKMLNDTLSIADGIAEVIREPRMGTGVFAFAFLDESVSAADARLSPLVKLLSNADYDGDQLAAMMAGSDDQAARMVSGMLKQLQKQYLEVAIFGDTSVLDVTKGNIERIGKRSIEFGMMKSSQGNLLTGEILSKEEGRLATKSAKFVDEFVKNSAKAQEALSVNMEITGTISNLLPDKQLETAGKNLLHMMYSAAQTEGISRAYPHLNAAADVVNHFSDILKTHTPEELEPLLKQFDLSPTREGVDALHTKMMEGLKGSSEMYQWHGLSLYKRIKAWDGQMGKKELMDNINKVGENYMKMQELLMSGKASSNAIKEVVSGPGGMVEMGLFEKGQLPDKMVEWLSSMGKFMRLAPDYVLDRTARSPFIGAINVAQNEAMLASQEAFYRTSAEWVSRTPFTAIKESVRGYMTKSGMLKAESEGTMKGVGRMVQKYPLMAGAAAAVGALAFFNPNGFSRAFGRQYGRGGEEYDWGFASNRDHAPGTPLADSTSNYVQEQVRMKIYDPMSQAPVTRIKSIHKPMMPIPRKYKRRNGIV